MKVIILVLSFLVSLSQADVGTDNQRNFVDHLIDFYDVIFSKKLLVFYCCLCWSMGLLSYIGPLGVAGRNSYGYDHNILTCTWSVRSKKTVTIIIMIAAVFIPCFLIMYFYLKIFVFSHQMKYQTIFTKISLAYSLRIAKGLFGSHLLFTFCW